MNVSLEVGATSETVEVKETLGAELQTESATMGTSLGGNAILQLPTISRDVNAAYAVRTFTLDRNYNLTCLAGARLERQGQR